VIAEHEINAVFDDRAMAQLLGKAKLKSSPSAKSLTETDRQRLADSIRTAVRCYLAESARTDWSAITKHIGKLYRLLEKADGGDAKAIAMLAKQVDAADAATRAWLERCVGLTFPSAGQIENKKTRCDAMRRLRRMLCDGWDWVEGRKRSGGRRSRSRQLWLRVPQKFGPWLRLPQKLGRRRTLAGRRGRPLDLAARELVHQLALTYLEVTGKRPPKRVNSKRAAPFLRVARRVFKKAGLPTGNVEELINERQKRREVLSTQFLSELSLEQAQELAPGRPSTSVK
jgi:hypothetical protein